jgi:hypothetical protein
MYTGWHIVYKLTSNSWVYVSLHVELQKIILYCICEDSRIKSASLPASLEFALPIISFFIILIYTYSDVGGEADGTCAAGQGVCCICNSFSFPIYRDRIYRRLRSPGIDSEESITSAYVARRASRAGNRFLGFTNTGSVLCRVHSFGLG